ncbi:MAG TPA: response regulator [Actinomycetota bacterium]|nr:response regulator [Actinomycetota bacterium]
MDDDGLHRGALIDALIFSGFSVAEAATGGEGIDAAAAGGVDAVLLDIGLPDVDGVDLIPRLREAARFAGLPVIALSGLTRAADRDRAFKAGCNAYMTKPPSVRELIGTLSILCLEGD